VQQPGTHLIWKYLQARSIPGGSRNNPSNLRARIVPALKLPENPAQAGYLARRPVSTRASPLTSEIRNKLMKADKLLPLVLWPDIQGVARFPFSAIIRF
jgi:hypothetical protein